MFIRPIVKTMLNRVPGVHQLLLRRQGGDTGSALYCYGVWLKHLTFLSRNGMQSVPNGLAELGPGASLGTGLAAMLCGVNKYHALDAVNYANPQLNLKILDELVALLAKREKRPTRGWPCFDAYLGPALFPHHVLTDELLARALAPDRIGRIRTALRTGADCEEISIRYVAPWASAELGKPDIDLVLSHSVLQYVPDLDQAYGTLSSWLAPGAMMSHQIDFGSMGFSDKWNGYRAYPEPLWRLISGSASHVINRQPVSVHLRLLGMHGMEIVDAQKKYSTDGIGRSGLAPAWRGISDDDLNCSGAFIQARKCAHGAPSMLEAG